MDPYERSCYPDGVDYPNMVYNLEVKKPERLAVSQLEQKHVMPTPARARGRLQRASILRSKKECLDSRGVYPVLYAGRE